jgi:glutathione synthase/RimK-type ligase-like ATP-grasp enzyme
MDIDCVPIDKESNLLRLELADKYHYFQINRTPFNSETVYCICKDKMHSYELLNSVVNMPKTLSFLDWKVAKKFKQYIQHESESPMIAEMESEFSYPFVLKKNQGALGENVYLCKDRQQAKQALDEIFNKQSYTYDYIALAQQFIPTHEEFRLLCAFGQPVLAYQRGNASEFNKEYWLHGEDALLIEDKQLIDELYQFIKPIYSLIDIGFCGFDIIRGKDNKLHLIELNSSPRFDHIIQASGESCVIEMYKKSLNLFIQKTLLNQQEKILC